MLLESMIFPEEVYLKKCKPPPPKCNNKKYRLMLNKKHKSTRGELPAWAHLTFIIMARIIVCHDHYRQRCLTISIQFGFGSIVLFWANSNNTSISIITISLKQQACYEQLVYPLATFLPLSCVFKH